MTILRTNLYIFDHEIWKFDIPSETHTQLF